MLRRQKQAICGKPQEPFGFAATAECPRNFWFRTALPEAAHNAHQFAPNTLYPDKPFHKRRFVGFLRLVSSSAFAFPLPLEQRLNILNPPSDPAVGCAPVEQGTCAGLL
jgi:hypothetical protein